jgi:hypothetical protein
MPLSKYVWPGDRSHIILVRLVTSHTVGVLRTSYLVLDLARSPHRLQTHDRHRQVPAGNRQHDFPT